MEGSRLLVAGYLFAKDFPEVERQMRQGLPGVMGMSWELADAHVEDMRAEIWTLTRATFTGAAILLREKAAYRNTSFELASARCRSTITRFAPAESVQAGATGHLRDRAKGAVPNRPTSERNRHGITHRRKHRRADRRAWSAWNPGSKPLPLLSSARPRCSKSAKAP